MSATPPNWEDHHDLLKLSTSQLVDLQQLRASRSKDPKGVDAGGAGGGGVNRRLSHRFPVEGALWAPVAVREPSGSLHLLKVYPIDMSAGGMCFLAGMFLHPGAECKLTMATAAGGPAVMTGRTTRCTHLRGRAHEVGLEFDQMFDVGTLAQGAAPGTVAPGPVADRRTAEDLIGPLKELRQLAEQLSSLEGLASRVRAIGSVIEGLAKSERRG